MKRLKVVGSVSLVYLALIAALAASSPAQQSLSSSNQDSEFQAEVKLYAHAHPYVDQPVKEVEKSVHELRGLEVAASPEPVTDLLKKTGAMADELLRKIPDLISDEVVNEMQFTIPANNASGCIGADCSKFETNRRSQKNQKFSYLILAHPNQYGQLQINEYRTGRNDKPVPQGTATPKFQGFITTWLVFSSPNQAESRFRYLGTQPIDGHNTAVVAFAQIPGSVESPGQYLTDTGPIPMLLQGIAWIDQSDCRIVRLRADILAPQPQVRFLEQTSNIVFGPVHVASSDLWLPEAVDVQMEADGQHLEEQHRYTNYRLYQVKSKIVLTPGN